MAYALLYMLTAFAVGRIQELFEFLAPLRIVFLMGVACVILALLTPRGKRQPVLAQREVRIVLGLGGLALLLVPFSVWPGGSLGFLLDSYSKVIVLFLLVVALAADPAVARKLVWAVLVGVGVLGIFTLGGASVKTSLEYTVARAYASSTYDPNDVAMIMVVTLPLAALGAASLKGGGRFGAAGVAVICVLTVIKTVSRGGFIGLACVSLLLIRRLRSAGARLLVSTTIVAALTVVAPAAYWDIMDSIWNPTGVGYVERGIGPRLEIWSRGLGLLSKHPLTGVGIGMYETAAGFRYGRNGGWVTAHNSFLQLAGELGLTGFVLFVMLLMFSIGNVRQTLRAAQADPGLRELEWIAAAVEISLYAYLVVGFTLSQAYAAILYFLVGVATALRVQVERRHPSAVPVEEAAGGRAQWVGPTAQVARHA